MHACMYMSCAQDGINFQCILCSTHWHKHQLCCMQRWVVIQLTILICILSITECFRWLHFHRELTMKLVYKERNFLLLVNLIPRASHRKKCCKDNSCLFQCNIVNVLGNSQYFHNEQNPTELYHTQQLQFVL